MAPSSTGGRSKTLMVSSSLGVESEKSPCKWWLGESDSGAVNETTSSIALEWEQGRVQQESTHCRGYL